MERDTSTQLIAQVKEAQLYIDMVYTNPAANKLAHAMMSESHGFWQLFAAFINLEY